MRQVAQWWESNANLATLYGWLVDNDAIDAEDHIATVAYLDKPWHWIREWESCQADMQRRGTSAQGGSLRTEGEQRE